MKTIVSVWRKMTLVLSFFNSKSIRLSGLLTASLLIASSCSKIVDPDTAIQPMTGAHPNARVAYDMDWEHIDFLPVPPNGPQIVIPWGGGASAVFNPGLNSKPTSASGWTLVYNTFNTEALPDVKYFILYNRYTGLLRLYFYAPPSNGTQESQLVANSINKGGNNNGDSPILNFANGQVVSVGDRQQSASGLDINKGTSPATWYCFQHEMAYDKNVAGKNFNDFALEWYLSFVIKQDLSIAGNLNGTINGSINTEGGSSLALSPTFNGRGTINVNSSNENDSFGEVLSGAFKNGIKEALTNGVSGVVKNILSGILGGSNEENTHLSIETTLNLTGSIKSGGGLSNLRLPVPGANQTGVQGFTPLYDQPLGIFYLDQTPTINVTSTQIDPPADGDGPANQFYQHDFSIDYSSLIPAFNPIVNDPSNPNNVASISNVFAEVVVTNPDDINIKFISGQQELVGDQKIYTNVNNVQSYGYAPNIILRYSFDVVPNGNPGGKVRIVKSFNVNVVHQ